MLAGMLALLGRTLNKFKGAEAAGFPALEAKTSTYCPRAPVQSQTERTVL